MREAASLGFWISSYAPYGYNRVMAQDGAKRRPTLAPDQDASRVVKRIFDLAEAGKGMTDITGTGLPLKRGPLGRMNQLEVHHIFPKSRLYQKGYHRTEVNALANFCFLTKDTNLQISDRFPEEYFPEVESKHPGALASQWVPTDPELWKVENYRDFLAERRRLLAAETNRRMKDLLHGDTRWFEVAAKPEPVPGGITSEDEEAELEALNEWIAEQELPRGQGAYDYTDPDTGNQLAVFDLAWPDGVQAELSQPVAILLDEGEETLAIAAKAGYRCFTRIQDFHTYIATEINPTVGVGA